MTTEERDLIKGYITYVDDRLKDMENTISTLNKVVAAISRFNDDVINANGLNN